MVRLFEYRGSWWARHSSGRIAEGSSPHDAFWRLVAALRSGPVPA